MKACPNDRMNDSVSVQEQGLANVRCQVTVRGTGYDDIKDENYLDHTKCVVEV